MAPKRGLEKSPAPDPARWRVDGTGSGKYKSRFIYPARARVDGTSLRQIRSALRISRPRAWMALTHMRHATGTGSSARAPDMRRSFPGIALLLQCTMGLIFNWHRVPGAHETKRAGYG